jgi:hypothetical protein
MLDSRSDPRVSFSLEHRSSIATLGLGIYSATDLAIRYFANESPFCRHGRLNSLKKIDERIARRANRLEGCASLTRWRDPGVLGSLAREIIMQMNNVAVPDDNTILRPVPSRPPPPPPARVSRGRLGREGRRTPSQLPSALSFFFIAHPRESGLACNG